MIEFVIVNRCNMTFEPVPGGKPFTAQLHLAHQLLLVVLEMNRQVLLQLEPLRELFLAEVAGEPQGLPRGMHQLIVAPKGGLIEIFIAYSAMLILDAFVSGNVLLVAGLPGEALVAYGACPRRL